MNAPTASLIRLALGLLVSVSTLHATADEAPPPSLVVQLSELNLNRPAGVSAAYRRIEAAARIVCPDESKQLRMEALRRQCIADAVARAIESLDVPALTAYHLDRTQQSNAAAVAHK